MIHSYHPIASLFVLLRIPSLFSARDILPPIPLTTTRLLPRQSAQPESTLLIATAFWRLESTRPHERYPRPDTCLERPFETKSSFEESLPPLVDHGTTRHVLRG